jgi:hypothetical protein
MLLGLPSMHFNRRKLKVGGALRRDHSFDIVELSTTWSLLASSSLTP